MMISYRGNARCRCLSEYYTILTESFLFVLFRTRILSAGELRAYDLLGVSEATDMGENQQYCLRWNNHRSNLLIVFDHLFMTESFTDVTLACDGSSIKCHKMVLAACSSYFQQLFMENECAHPIVILKDILFSEIKAILEYMYRGEVNVGQEELAGLLKAAETLRVKGLVEDHSSSSSSSAANNNNNNNNNNSTGGNHSNVNSSSNNNGNAVNMNNAESPLQGHERQTTNNNNTTAQPATSASSSSSALPISSSSEYHHHQSIHSQHHPLRHPSPHHSRSSTPQQQHTKSSNSLNNSLSSSSSSKFIPNDSSPFNEYTNNIQSGPGTSLSGQHHHPHHHLWQSKQHSQSPSPKHGLIGASNNCYEAEPVPHKKKKFLPASNGGGGKDTPILRTVLGHTGLHHANSVDSHSPIHYSQQQAGPSLHQIPSSSPHPPSFKGHHLPIHTNGPIDHGDKVKNSILSFPCSQLPFFLVVLFYREQTTRHDGVKYNLSIFHFFIVFQVLSDSQDHFVDDSARGFDGDRVSILKTVSYSHLK
jgi:hypothetical protein